MSRSGIEVEIIFLDILAMVTFRTRETEETFFEDRIVLVPQRQRKTDELLPITNTAESIFVPTIGSGARMIMRKIVPCRAIRAVVFADSAPGAFAEVWSPTFPVDFTFP